MDHHNEAHSEGAFRDRLRLLALSRLVAYLAPRIREVLELGEDMIRTEPPRAAYEWLITIAQSAGVPPPGWQEA